MTAYAFRISLECPHCRNGVPVNGFTHEVLCSGCLKSIPLNQDWWDTLLPMEKIEKALADPPSVINYTKFLSGMGERLEYGNRACSCQSCNGPLGEEWIAKVGEKEGAPCPQCKAIIRVRKATELVRSLIPEADLLVQEGATGAELDKELGKTAQPVIFGCLSCGAALPVDGTTRTPKCGHCSNENYLPDALWLRLHPAPVSHTFFVTRAATALPVHITPDDITPSTTEERAKRILANKETSAEVIRKLSTTFSSNHRVLKLLAHHPNTPEDVAQYLSLPQHDVDVRYALSQRPNLSHSVMEKLAVSPESKIRAQLARMRSFYSLPAETVNATIKDLTFKELGPAFGMKEFPAWKVTEMSVHCGEENAPLVLTSPHISPKILKAMGHNPDLRPLIKKHRIYKELGPLRRAFFFW